MLLFAFYQMYIITHSPRERIIKNALLVHFPMQHVELFHYENLTLKTVENLFLSSRR